MIRAPRFSRPLPLLAACFFLGASVLVAASDAPAERPNVILLLADDMGWHDASCFGDAAVETPHIDDLAERGMRWTQFYAGSAVCTPTRASVLTGRYPLRFDIRQHFRDRVRYLPRHATTLAELLRDAGYATAHVGKWHLGGLHVDEQGRRKENQPGPAQHGFEFYQTQIEQQPLRGRMGRERRTFRDGGTALIRNGRVVGEDDPAYDEHFTDINGDTAVRLIERYAGEDRPFFINLWWLVPHKPYEPAPEPHWSDTAADGISDDQHRFRSMMAHMDARIGDIVAKVGEMGIAEDTLIVFVSDNGAAFEGRIGPLKGGKTDLHEGGIRVPAVFTWPGRIPAGAATDVLGHTNDLLPTVCAAAGVELPPGKAVDGLDLLPHLADRESLERGAVFWQLDLYRGLQRHYPKPKPYATEVARRGPWKLMARDGEPVALYDLEEDIGETTDRLGDEPELADELAAEVKGFLEAPRRPEPGR